MNKRQRKKRDSRVTWLFENRDGSLRTRRTTWRKVWRRVPLTLNGSVTIMGGDAYVDTFILAA
jgi:hypothetical protein